VKSKSSVENEGPAPLHTQGLADVWDSPVLSLCGWLRDFRCYNAPIGTIGKGISNQERITSQFLHLVVGQIVRVACRNDVLQQSDINGGAGGGWRRPFDNA
jgi:hypothetical protein